MEGMKEKEDKYVKFDTPGGRLIEFEVETFETPSRIKEYYKETLTALGWQLKKIQETKIEHQRENECLTLDFSKSHQVIFSLTPCS